jgi:hypothetical protein
MKKIVIITFSLMAFLVFCSKSCETPEDQQAGKEEAALKATLDSISNSFSADQLSEQSLRSLEVKAKQKLTDLADYLQIYADKSLDEAFREHARQMILDLFISDTVHIFFKVSDNIKEKSLTINDFLKMDPGPGKKSTDFIFDSIELSEPLRRMNDLNYKGSLKFSQRYEVYSDTNSTITGSVHKKIDVIVTKVRKQFGTDTLEIWQVSLGDIR